MRKSCLLPGYKCIPSANGVHTPKIPVARSIRRNPPAENHKGHRQSVCQFASLRLPVQRAITTATNREYARRRAEHLERLFGVFGVPADMGLWGIGSLNLQNFRGLAVQIHGSLLCIPRDITNCLPAHLFAVHIYLMVSVTDPRSRCVLASASICRLNGRPIFLSELLHRFLHNSVDVKNLVIQLG